MGQIVMTPSLDGVVGREFGINEPWFTLIAGAGNAHNDTASSMTIYMDTMVGPSPNFAGLYRGVLLFNPTALPAGARITGGSLKLTVTTGTTFPYGSSLVLTNAPIGSYAGLANTDFALLGLQKVEHATNRVLLSSIPTGEVSTITFTLNAQAILTFQSLYDSGNQFELGLLFDFDFDESNPGWISAAKDQLVIFSVEEAVSSRRPELTIDYVQSGFFECAAPPATGYSECAAAPPTGFIPCGDSAPVASGVSISGTTQVGQMLTGSYTYSDADGDLEGTTTFKWYRDGVAIAGATASTYTLVEADEGTAIRFGVTPVALTGVRVGTEVLSASVGPIQAETVLPVTSGLVAWHDAQQITGLNDGDGISTMADLSGNGHTLTGVVNNPLYRDGTTTEGINSKPCVRFVSGTTDILRYVNDYLLNGASAAEVFIVLKNDLDPQSIASRTGLWHFAPSDFDVHHPYTDGNVYEAFGRATRVNAGNPTPSMAAMHVYNVISASGEYTININGSQLYTNATNTPSFLSTGGSGGEVGNGKSGSYQYAGLMGELVIFNRKLTTQERSDMVDYFNGRWT